MIPTYEKYINRIINYCEARDIDPVRYVIFNGLLLIVLVVLKL